MKIDTGQGAFLVDKATGEVIVDIDDGFNVNVRSPAQTENDKYWSPREKIKGRFVKVMVDNEERVFEMLKGLPAVYMAFNRLKKYLQINENTVMKDGRKYKTSDLAEEMCVRRQMACFYIRKLKELNLIAELDNGRKGKVLVVNPHIYLAGVEVPMKTLKLFENKGN